MESAGQTDYNKVNIEVAVPFQRVSDGMLLAWYRHLSEFFPLQAQQFTKTILRTLEMHRERADYLQGQLDKVMGLAFASQQTGTPVDPNQLLSLTGIPNV